MGNLGTTLDLSPSDPIGAPGPSSSRSDPYKRRHWLRNLDSALCGEMEEAGALSCDELAELAARPLKGRQTQEIVEEWWEYSYRRGWIEQHGDNRGLLSTIGRDGVHARRQSDAGYDPATLAKGILRWLLPAGTLYATGYLSHTYPKAVVAIVVVGIGVAVGLLLASPILAWGDRVIDRQGARRACDWLEDRPVRFAKDQADPANPSTRLYRPSDRSAPGLARA